MDDIQATIKQADRAFNLTERNNQQINWELIAEFMLPNQSGIFLGKETPGAKKTRRLFDSTAIQANHDLSAAIHATLTNPATKWSKLKFKDRDLNNNPEALEWLDNANKTIHDTINESNFDTMVSKNYQAFTSLGTMVLFQDEEKGEDGLFEGFNFEAIHLSQVAFSENSKGVADTFYRKYMLTVSQIADKFPDKIPQDLKEELKVTPDKEYEVYLCIKKRSKYNKGLTDKLNRPYSSQYILKKGAILLAEEGYYEFPVIITRWQTMPGEVYGRGPGHIALPDVRTLNRVKELGLQAIDKAINPPMIATQRSIVGALNLNPGKLSIVRELDGFKELVPNARYDVTQFAVQDLREAIRSVFFIDKLFLPPRTETGEMTAFEIDQRLSQMQRVLGPTLSRLNSEFLSPLILRCFKILLRNRVLPPIPDILRERGLNVEINFVNQLSRAQQIEELTTVDQWVRRMGEAAQIKPEILDYVDADQYAKYSARILGISETLLTNDDVVEEIRQARNEMAQQQQQLEAGIGVADILSKTGGMEEM